MRTEYTNEERSEALALLAEHGKAEAARRTGIPVGTIGSWGSRHHIASPPIEAKVAAVEQKLTTMADRKIELAERVAGVLDRAIRKLDDRIRNDEISTTTLVRATDRLVDRLLLLTGEATERIETLTGRTVGEEALAVVDELAARRVS